MRDWDDHVQLQGCNMVNVIENEMIKLVLFLGTFNVLGLKSYHFAVWGKCKNNPSWLRENKKWWRTYCHFLLIFGAFKCRGWILLRSWTLLIREKRLLGIWYLVLFRRLFRFCKVLWFSTFKLLVLLLLFVIFIFLK